MVGAILFWLGSRHYVKDLGTVAQITLEAE